MAAVPISLSEHPCLGIPTRVRIWLNYLWLTGEPGRAATFVPLRPFSGARKALPYDALE
jgi:hypothetical protein